MTGVWSLFVGADNPSLSGPGLETFSKDVPPSSKGGLCLTSLDLSGLSSLPGLLSWGVLVLTTRRLHFSGIELPTQDLLLPAKCQALTSLALNGDASPSLSFSICFERARVFVCVCGNLHIYECTFVCEFMLRWSEWCTSLCVHLHVQVFACVEKWGFGSVDVCVFFAHYVC